MAHSPVIVLLAIVSVSLLYRPVSSVNTVFDSKLFSCVIDGNASDSYLNNRNLMFSDFVSQSSLQGYYNTSVGKSPDTVFGYYMCRGDINLKDCGECIVNATEIAQEADCKHQGGMFFTDKCMFRYANHSMYGLWERNSTIVYTSTGTNLSNYNQQYNQTLATTLEDLISEAASPSNNMSSVLGFATKSVEVTGDEKIYSLAQCTPDIVGVNCSMCLRDSLSTLRSCCFQLTGAELLKPNCQIRYDNHIFYSGESSLRPSSVLVYSSLLLLILYYSSTLLVLV